MAFEPNISVVAQIGAGFLAVMPKPTTGEWIEEEFANISAFGIHQVVSLMELDEAADVDLQDESQLCQANGMRFVSYPICDRGLPSSLNDFARFTYELFREIEAGTNTVVHCLAGIGRSGIVSGAVLVHSGMDAEEAFAQISQARGLRVPDTEQQRDWLVRHQSAIKSEPQNKGRQATASPSPAT
ncbi:MAG: dual specificity protein phosphatase family protein [Verrucomicrobiales bacterium]|nr:dual specificity protein phosphatase family protein [Verrucomicrobiales bacterium]